jgi:KTSC domain
MSDKRIKLNGSQLTWATYDEREQRLEIEFASRDSKVFKAVPREIFLRLSQSPNAQAYYEDRIEPEYASQRGATKTASSAVDSLNSLFGASPAKTKDAGGDNH